VEAGEIVGAQRRTFSHVAFECGMQVRAISCRQQSQLPRKMVTLSLAGVDDIRPEWLPIGQSIVFIRTDPVTHTSQVMRWDLGSPTVQTLRAISPGVVLGGAQLNCSSPFTRVNPLGQRPTFACFRGHLCYAKIVSANKDRSSSGDSPNRHSAVDFLGRV